MTPEEKYKIISNDYADLFIEYNRNPALLERYPNATTQIINNRYAVAYVPASQLNDTFISQYGYWPLPHVYGLTSEESLEASGVQRLRRLPGFDLQGEGVLVGLIDTGIDYTNPIFIRSDGTSKIIALWDQTIDSSDQYPPEIFYGTEYNQTQLNEALGNENPLLIVPSTDEIGHGTMLAGVMAGLEVPAQSFSGVVPGSDLVVVKLKQAKQNLRDFYIIPSDVPCYQENDILWGVEYLLRVAQNLNRPCAVCIGLGSSLGAHDGKGSLSNTLSIYAGSAGFILSVSAGNEGSGSRHSHGIIPTQDSSSTVELNVGENEPGFTMELWGTPPNTYSIDILSPSGEYIPRITESLGTRQTISFIFERTVIELDYQLIETRSSAPLIFMRFYAPTSGIWRFRVYTRGDLQGEFNIWLPLNGFISDLTYFLQPDPYITITSPGNSLTPITTTAYNPNNNALYENASKGFSRIGTIKPDLAAPGVNITVPTLDQGFTSASGTGLAASHMAGISAILLEWGIVRGFYPGMDTDVIKKYLIRGARRSSTFQYPNRDWGYGIVDIYNVFNVLRADFPTIP